MGNPGRVFTLTHTLSSRTVYLDIGSFVLFFSLSLGLVIIDVIVPFLFF